MPIPITWEQPCNSAFAGTLFRRSRGEKLEHTAARIVVQSASVLCLACAAAYLLLAIVSALLHPLWFDEVNTALLARLPLGRLWDALVSGADTNPPLLYLPVKLFYRMGANQELACRVPAILAFGLLMVSLYALTRRYASPLYSLCAALLPFLTTAGLYATEARGYAGLLGFSALALLCWRNASDGVSATPWLAGMAVSIAAAVSYHYSASLILLALAVGETSRTLLTRRVRCVMWISLGLGAVPLLLYRPLLPAIRRYLISYWARPSWRDLVYALVSGWKWMGALALLLFFVWLLRNRLPAWLDSPQYQTFRIPLPERLAWLTLLAAPVFGYLQGRVTGGFTLRYAVVMAIPASTFLALSAYRTFRGAALPGVILLALAFSFMTERLLITGMRPRPTEQQATWIIRQAEHFPEPVVIGDASVFSPLYLYAPASLRPRLVYLSDPALSTRYLGMNSPDLNLSELRKFSSLPVIDYRRFTGEQVRFFVFSDDSTWLLPQLAADRADIKQVTCRHGWCLQEVSLANLATNQFARSQLSGE